MYTHTMQLISLVMDLEMERSKRRDEYSKREKEKIVERENRRIPRSQSGNHMMYVPVLSSEFAHPHQVYIAVIKSPGINFAYAQLCT